MKTCAKIICNCKHEFQDQEHGKQVRVASLVTKTYKHDQQKVDVRCTVCKAIHSVNKTSLT